MKLLTEPGYSALCLSSRGKDPVGPRIMKKLLAAGAPPDGCQGQYNMTPLHVICRDKCVWAVPILLAAGVEVDPVDEMGRVPLHYCGWMGDTEGAKAIIAAGAKAGDNKQLLVKDAQDKTPAAIAKQQAQRETQALIESFMPPGTFEPGASYVPPPPEDAAVAAA